MGKFLILWRSNLAAPAPEDPAEYLEFMEKMWAGVDGLREKGLVKELGNFLDGISGYAIAEGEAAEVYNAMSMFIPFVVAEAVHEIIPDEKGREIDRARIKARIEAAKK